MRNNENGKVEPLTGSVPLLGRRLVLVDGAISLVVCSLPAALAHLPPFATRLPLRLGAHARYTYLHADMPPKAAAAKKPKEDVGMFVCVVVHCVAALLLRLLTHSRCRSLPTRTGSGTVAERMIIDYLNQQNRPFSAQLLQTSLSSQGLTKTQITKALDKLALEGAITEGTFGKTKIYWRVQEDEPDADGDSSASSLESEVQALSAELKELQRETSTIEART